MRDKNLLMQCASPISIKVDDQIIELTNASGYTIRSEQYVLAILGVFHQPISLENAIDKLSKLVLSKATWVVLMEQVQTLIAEGFLVETSQARKQIKLHSSFSSPDEHIAMLNDKQRTHAFIDAIKDVIKENDVVLDIGTGTGILAVAAAKAGAKKVYAIEATDMAYIARDFIRQNGFEHIIEVIHSWSTETNLPEKANVLVSETIGNGVLDENILQIFMDAKARLLTDDARIIPYTLDVFVLPIDISEAMRQRLFFSSEGVKRWFDEYQIDFASLIDHNPSQIIKYVQANELNEITILGEPVQLVKIDLHQPNSPINYLKTQLISIPEAQRFYGLLLYVDIALSPSHTLSLHPQITQGNTSWSYRLTLLSKPLESISGAAIKLRLRDIMSNLIDFSIDV